MSGHHELKIYCGHAMPWPGLLGEEETPYDAPFLIPNSLCQPDIAAGAFEIYLNQLSHAANKGFDGLYLAQAINSPASMLADPFAVAAMLADRVPALPIAIGNLFLGGQDPVDLARRIAMLDAMTGGRIEAGISFGAGSNYWADTVHPAKARLRFAEAVSLFLQCLQQSGPFRHEGPHFMQRHANIWPRPAQGDNLPIFVTGGGDTPGLEAANTHNLPYMPDCGTGLNNWPNASRAAQIHVLCADNDAAADDLYAAHIERAKNIANITPNYATPPGYLTRQEFVDSLDAAPEKLPDMLVGSGKKVAEDLQSLVRDQKLTSLVILPHIGAMPDALAKQNIDIIGRDILPVLKQTDGTK